MTETKTQATSKQLSDFQYQNKNQIYLIAVVDLRSFKSVQELCLLILKLNMSIWIWNGKKTGIKYSTLQLAKNRGVMALPNLKDYYEAAQFDQQLSGVTRIITKWNEIEMRIASNPVQSLLGNIS